MNFIKLRKVRVVISVTTFAIFTILFLDIHHLLPPSLLKIAALSQFIPSFLNLTEALQFAAISFLIFTLLAFLFGRVYCSTLCPLGILQDIFSKISKRFKKRFKYHYSDERKYLRYGFLLIAILLFIFGNIFGLLLLDPYSNFGRIITSFINPLLIGLNNAASFTLENLDIYWFYPVEFKSIGYFSIFFSWFVLLLILYLSANRGRLFCNTVCPVGTFLGFISKFSFYKIKVEETNCSKCGVCETVCKSECIDSKGGVIDFSRCVNCLNCFTVCPSKAVVYQSDKVKKAVTVNEDKRNFIAGVALFFAGGKITSLAQDSLKVLRKTSIPEYKLFPVSPPGASSISEFNDKCTACTLCVTACPTKVIQPSFLEYGFTSMLQPRMDYHKSFCNYDCVACTEVCPTGALKPLKIEEKKLTQLGKAKLIEDNCIVFKDKTMCAACSEHCPTKAVHTVPYEKNLLAPEIDEEICIGCGACEFACPTKPYKSIYVEGNLIHQRAEKPKSEKQEIEIDYKEEFPF